ncbi:nucleotide-diphospho-sugar transferase [Annulohypoxylon maeteangense]|uniref:nucleotide-diphospho-sugar transferase n=1 Tax=Annulohypoxylon maeteangense TaxID=1927788 RepID=UPI0020073A07|nr:nucleotide-diphospho-sugar transferase [Annulohypoxylon maeteangense]KAI0886513.1 nucleotide-diphospho-sugar transferase [Annulohypoxylon maeteangense]
MSQNKGAKGGASAKGKKSGKPGTEDKREDVLQAVLIADSFQTRFHPFSIEKPRCLLPLANTPLIEYSLEFLAMNGVQEVFIYCGNHHEQIERYINSSRWCPGLRSCPFTTLEFIRVADARSIGDFLRDLDKRNIIGGDFVLVHGDLVANIPLDGILAAHRARREANRDSCMTVVLREAGEGEHNTKTKGITPAFIIDPKAKRCLHYEEIHPLQADHYVTLDPTVLENREAEARTDLIDAEIDICTPDVLALWSESFDYELPRANFLHGVLKDWELNGKMIHTEIVNEGYSARVRNLQMYDAISRDVLNGWTYPFVPECNLLTGQTYQLRGINVYREDDVEVEGDSEVVHAILGKDTHVGAGSTIRNSVIGRNCKIGSNVRIVDSFIWDDAIINDGAVVEHAIIAERAAVGKEAYVHEGALVSFGVHLGNLTDVEPGTMLSLFTGSGKPASAQSKFVGSEGKGALFQSPEDDEEDPDGPSHLQKSLIYSLEELDFSDSSVSTLGDDDDLSDDDSGRASATPSQLNSRSRLSSFASDDSGGPNFYSFHSDAVHGLLDVLRGTSGNFESEKLEFMSLRLANNASDAAMRKAVATAFVRRAVELTNAENGALEPSKAAKQVLTSREGAIEFISEVGVGDQSVTEQLEFALAVHKACASSAKIIEATKAGNLLAAMLQQMYDLEILDEDGILGWWEDDRGKEEGLIAGVREKCKMLVEWLENADEESEEEGDDDE